MVRVLRGPMSPLALGLVLTVAAVARADTPLPTIEGPISSPGSAFIQGTSFDLLPVGYLQEEYFLSGTASAYTNTAPMLPDGRWSVEATTPAAYKTRIVVRRPTYRKRFNGIVLVEWLNVSGGLDASPDWVFMHTELIRRGWSDDAIAGIASQNFVRVWRAVEREGTRLRRTTPPAIGTVSDYDTPVSGPDLSL